MLNEGDTFIYKGLSFSLLYMDHTEDESEEYAVVCDDILNDYDDTEACVGFVSPDATDDEVMEVIKSGLDEILSSGYHRKNKGDAIDISESLDDNTTIADFYANNDYKDTDVYASTYGDWITIIWDGKEASDDYERFLDDFIHNTYAKNKLDEYSIEADIMGYVKKRYDALCKLAEEENREEYLPSKYDSKEDKEYCLYRTLMSLLNGDYSDKDYKKLLDLF